MKAIRPSSSICTIARGPHPDLDGPIVAVAIHDGHAVRDELVPLMAIHDEDRSREEDRFTSLWTNIAPTRVVALRSRFEVDLNRRRERAVYRSPSDAWGLRVWKETLGDDVIDRSLAVYDAFYDQMRTLLDDLVQRHGHFFVYDLHSYNHRRRGPKASPDDPAKNPQINICTGGMDLERCGAVVDCFENAMGRYRLPDHVPMDPFDVRRNIRFRATRFSRWVHENYPGIGVSMALELSKFYMDEWTGQPYPMVLHTITEALRSTVAPVRDALESL